MKKVILENVKAIRRLEFELPNRRGVHLVTGRNGTGKTNLLVALYRICNGDAFRDNFPLGANNFDDISRYRITYENNGSIVTYFHTGHGWDPHPRNTNVLNSFGYSDTIYVSATKMRFDVHTPSELQQQRLRKQSVSQDFKNAMNLILGTTKFNNLKYIQLVNRGRPGRQIRHNNKLYIIDGFNYSENTFSLGERFVLNMLDQLEGVQNDTLVIIDEIELALHPIAQIAFYNYLDDLAKSKNLTVIIATHSPSLIKNCNSIFYLENNGGNITVLNKCKPSYILSGLTNSVDNNYDKVFLVEDEMAYYCLDTILKKHFQQTPQLLNYKIVFVGGWPQVIEFLKQMNTILPYKPGMVFAYLDYDAQVDLNRLVTTPNLNDGEQRVLDSYNNVRQYVSFLHITPEIGIWDWLVNNEHAFLNQWRIKTNNALFQLNSSINNIDSIHNHARKSDCCKKCLNDLLVQLVSVPDYPEEVCKMIIVEIYYEQAVFNNQMWAGMNQNLYSQLNS
jgi:predicted ATPase